MNYTAVTVKAVHQGGKQKTENFNTPLTLYCPWIAISYPITFGDLVMIMGIFVLQPID